MGLVPQGLCVDNMATAYGSAFYIHLQSLHWFLMVLWRLIHSLWLLLRNLWDHRNTILHDTVPVAVQLATVQPNAAVSGQYHIYHQGLDGLSPNQFRSYFSRPLIDLLALTVAYKRNWLANLLAARDDLATHTTPVNQDQERRCLQAWLDLPKQRRPRACRL